MKTELQNQAWACLPEDFRREVREIYVNTIENCENTFYDAQMKLCQHLFGTHNLTSEKEVQDEIKPNIHVKDGESEFKAWFGDNPSISMTAPIGSNEPKHGKIVIPVKAEFDDSIWLPYRMELAKEITIAMIRSIGRVKDSEVFEIVDGIVERLKGGEK